MLCKDMVNGCLENVCHVLKISKSQMLVFPDHHADYIRIYLFDLTDQSSTQFLQGDTSLPGTLYATDKW